MTPPHADSMRLALYRDPFWVPPSEVDQLTDRQMWEWYIYPQMKENLRGTHEGARMNVRRDEQEGVWNEAGHRLTPEQVAVMLAGTGIAIRKREGAGDGG